MRLKAACPQCQEQLRVADTRLGQRTKCPRCDHRFVLFLETLIDGYDLSETKTWYLRDESEEQQGPLDYQALVQMLATGNLDANYQLWLEGWPQWKWADEIFQQLATESLPERPRDGSGPAFDFQIPDDSQPTTVEQSSSQSKHGQSRATELPAGLIRAVNETTPWLLIAIVSCGLVAGAALVGALLDFLQMGGNQGSNGHVAFWLISLSLFACVPIAYLLPTYRRMLEFDTQRDTTRLTHVTESQRSLWKILSLLPIVAIAYVVAVFLLSLMSGTTWFFGGE